MNYTRSTFSIYEYPWHHFKWQPLCNEAPWFQLRRFIRSTRIIPVTTLVCRDPNIEIREKDTFKKNKKERHVHKLVAKKWLLRITWDMANITGMMYAGWESRGQYWYAFMTHLPFRLAWSVGQAEFRQSTVSKFTRLLKSANLFTLPVTNYSAVCNSLLTYATRCYAVAASTSA